MTTRPVDELLAAFPPERTCFLPALQRVQADRGWLSPYDLAAVAAHLHVPASEVYGVATHYPELRLAAPGRHVVRVCAGVSCRLNGSLGLLQEFGRRLGVATGHTTPDGAVTLEEADCCFVCGVARWSRWTTRTSARRRRTPCSPRAGLRTRRIQPSRSAWRCSRPP
jgi:NADH:ubiquinone oxidoreductase subunit E